MTTESKEVMQYAAGEAVEIWNRAKPALDNFLKETSKKPTSSQIKKNKFANNAEYVEVGYIEAKLDQVYHGLWTWEITDTQQIINGIMVVGNLQVFHPVANLWLARAGIGFKQFQLASGKTDPTPQNLSSKALERDVPIAAAEAFKNAAKKLGNAFGRHLNRGFKYEHVADTGIMDRVFNTKAAGEKPIE